jgi:hypothetical protein
MKQMMKLEMQSGLYKIGTTGGLQNKWSLQQVVYKTAPGFYILSTF